jgi:CTP synthase
MVMAIILVKHDTPEPALFGAMAGVVAMACRAELAHFAAVFDGHQMDAIQHVAAVGALVPSGLIWVERLAKANVGREEVASEMVQRAQSRDLVVPCHRSVAADVQEFVCLADRAADARVTLEHVDIVDDGCGFLIRSRDPALIETPARWERDRFGRLGAAKSPGAPTSREPSRPHIALVGTETDHREVYPAVLAALGDASDVEGVAPDIIFVPPVGLRRQDVDNVLAEVDGVVLPGGSDMANVPGQILMSHGVLRSRTPTIGLCLGMQTMTTAVAQKALGSSRANLAEADPSAPIKTFVQLSADGSLPAHRLGERTITIAAGSRLGYLLGAKSIIRCNHRFRLNPDLEPILERSGLHITAHDSSRRIAEAIELADHPFYVGIQGHPELSSRFDAPHPVIRAFLQACNAHRQIN